jgi:small-conductance mechanosensitive channel
MELDDLKNTWDAASNQPGKENYLTPKMIDQMTQDRYGASLKKIAYPEMAGILICLTGAVYTGQNFYKLNTVWMQAAGVIAILLLLTLPVISIISTRQLTMAKDVNKTYAETLKEFANKKLKFHKLQRLNVTLSYLLLVMTIILFSRFFSGKDITGSKYFWIFSFSAGYLFLLFYSRWVLKYYRKSLGEAEELLKELPAG